MAPGGRAATIAYVPALVGSKPIGLTIGFQPRIVPSSVANKKTAGWNVGNPPAVTPEILNPPSAPPAALKTTPVGVPALPSGWPATGIETTKACGLPAVLYNVETPAPLSEIQNGDAADSPTPHGLTRWGSKNFATWTTPFASVRVGTPLTNLLTTRSVST